MDVGVARASSGSNTIPQQTRYLCLSKPWLCAAEAQLAVLHPSCRRGLTGESPSINPRVSVLHARTSATLSSLDDLKPPFTPYLTSSRLLFNLPLSPPFPPSFPPLRRATRPSSRHCRFHCGRCSRRRWRRPRPCLGRRSEHAAADRLRRTGWRWPQAHRIGR